MNGVWIERSECKLFLEKVKKVGDAVVGRELMLRGVRRMRWRV